MIIYFWSNLLNQNVKEKLYEIIKSTQKGYKFNIMHRRLEAILSKFLGQISHKSTITLTNGRTWGIILW